jgi:hypothetical protein
MPGRAETSLASATFRLLRLDSQAKIEIFFRRPSDKLAIWSGRRDLNPRPSPWQGDALPLSYSRIRPEAVYRAAHRPVNARPYSFPVRYSSTAVNTAPVPDVVSTSSFACAMGSNCCLIRR